MGAGLTVCGFPAFSSPLAKEASRVAFVDPKTLWEVTSSIGRRDIDIGSCRVSLKGSERNSGCDVSKFSSQVSIWSGGRTEVIERGGMGGVWGQKGAFFVFLGNLDVVRKSVMVLHTVAPFPTFPSLPLVKEASRVVVVDTRAPWEVAFEVLECLKVSTRCDASSSPSIRPFQARTLAFSVRERDIGVGSRGGSSRARPRRGRRCCCEGRGWFSRALSSWVSSSPGSATKGSTWPGKSPVLSLGIHGKVKAVVVDSARPSEGRKSQIGNVGSWGAGVFRPLIGTAYLRCVRRTDLRRGCGAVHWLG